MISFLKNNAFIQQTCIKLIKSDSEGIYNVTRLAVLLNFLFIKQLIATIFNIIIINVS